MAYKTSQKIEIDFTPWFNDGHHRLTRLHLYEELGGDVAHGSMDLEQDNSSEALKLDDEERTGILTITDTKDRGLSYTIPIFITRLDRQKNFVTINFLCIRDKDFYFKKRTETFKQKQLKDLVGGDLYPGEKFIRTESDIQSPLDFYQSQETNHEFLTRLCLSYKKNSIFAFGWEGLMIKDTMGEKNSYGKTEPDDKMQICGDSEYMQKTEFVSKYNNQHYYPTLNIWEDSEGKYALSDYTEQESMNLRTYRRYETNFYLHADYAQLYENLMYNSHWENSDLFQTIILKNTTGMPLFKIGDVVDYKKINILQNKNINWPYKYYLVKSNELFLTLDGSNYVDDEGYPYSWTVKLVGLEESGTIALGSEEDPQEGKVAE